MLQKMTRTNEKGFTLIELMIVIAIIGILAAIAIPNFISYRNKAFCSAAESDANSVAAAIADYFAIPAHRNTPTGLVIKTTNNNTYTIAGTDPNINITITVADVTGRCPADYRAAATATVNAKGYWSGSSYIKIINQ